MRLGGPDERLWVFVVDSDVLLDGGGQFRNTAEHTGTQALGCDVAEESLDHVEP